MYNIDGNVLSAELAIGLISILQSYVEDTIELDCYKCPFYNGYHCLLAGCLGQNDADTLMNNIKNYEKRCKEAASNAAD